MDRSNMELLDASFNDCAVALVGLEKAWKALSSDLIQFVFPGLAESVAATIENKGEKC